jgi:hypothetical protein
MDKGVLIETGGGLFFRKRLWAAAKAIDGEKRRWLFLLV